MGPNEKQKIEIEKLHRDPLPPLNQAVTAGYSDFLGTALMQNLKSPGRESRIEELKAGHSDIAFVGIE
jgi:hypothetical protein